MATAVSLNSAIKPLQSVLSFTIKRVDDIKNVIPEGQALQNECEVFDKIIAGVLDKQNLPINGILVETNDIIQKTDNLIKNYIAEDNKKDRSIGSKLVWKVKRIYLARTYRHLFKSTIKKLEQSKKKIHDTMALSTVVNKPTVHWYRDDMPNEKAFNFWKEICGEGPYAAKWNLFTQSYQQHYGGNWDDKVLNQIRHVTCCHGDLLTVPGFINLTNQCGFPLNLNMLPELDDYSISPPLSSAASRMEVAKLLNELVIYKNSTEFRDQIQPIFTWYLGCNKWERNGKPWQDRANEWADEMLKNQYKGIGEQDERVKLAMEVDNAKRTYMTFFQRYMIIFKIGQLSRELLVDLDFPGMTTINEFIDYVKPLDNAYYQIVMGGDILEWKSKQPKVYTFLDNCILSEKQKGKQKADYHQVSNVGKALKALEDSQIVESISGLSMGTTSTAQDSDKQFTVKFNFSNNNKT